MNTNEILSVDEARRRANTELEAYREKIRRQKEAKARAEQSADEEIASAIRSRRAEEAHLAEVRAERERFYAEREAQLEDLRKAEREKMAAGEPRFHLAETPARRLAKVLRKRLGDDFDSVAAEIMAVDFKTLKLEIARIPQDELCAALRVEREAQAAARAAAALELPVPEDEAEAEILAKYGFSTRAA